MASSPTKARLPSHATKSIREFHRHATSSEKEDIVNVAQQDPVHVLLHNSEAGDPYYIGDVYEAQPLEIAKEWEIDTTNMPYLLHIKSLCQGWPHFRWLADFMEVSTTPLRWQYLKGKDKEEKRTERAERTRVVRLDFRQDGSVETSEYSTPQELRTALDRRWNVESDDNPIQLQYFLVEDLSRTMIEYLGSTFDLDPSFFREHVNDYAWYNVRDRFMDPPSLDIISKRQDWFQVRWVRARYFRDRNSFERARVEADRFNVLRRPDEDLNNKGLQDTQSATVAHTRTRASFWRSTKHEDGQIPTAILLTDPTVKEGSPMWRGYRNWEKPPSLSDHTSSREGPPNTSLFNDIVYWTKKSYHPSPHLTSDNQADAIMPIQAFLHLVCAEWLTMISYLSTRLSQLEWEIAFPEDFKLEEGADSSLAKLSVWRRLVPLYLEMMNDTLERVFNYPPKAIKATTPAAADPAFYALKPSFEQALTKMEELQHRLNRLTSIATAQISIRESRLAFQENKNISRLSWLATIFIPLTFVSGLFSIQPVIPDLLQSFKYYFAVSLPLAVITISVAALVQMKFWREWFNKIFKAGQEGMPPGDFIYYGKDHFMRHKHAQLQTQNHLMRHTHTQK